MNITQVIIRPVITEKSAMRVAENQYTFEVHRNATKRDIAKAVGNKFNVEVYDAKVINRRGKKRRFGPSRREKFSPSKRFAIITINPKQKIELFEQGEEK
ncbi:50S ribosomal protein L23 [Patescibacteria group bacterium]|nr:50S ribosomal protein L23 [Patescibacteria group bacterium]MBU1867884.1 50S ribosomal protein L23 [Patescibacteria group bacterium]